MEQEEEENGAHEGPALPTNKRMQSSVVITGPDGKIMTRVGLVTEKHLDPAPPAPRLILPRSISSGTCELDTMLNSSKKGVGLTSSQPSIRQAGYWTPQPVQKKSGLCPTPLHHHHHLLTPGRIPETPLGSEYASSTPTTTQSSRARARPPMSSSRKLRSKAVARLRMLDDQELQAARLVQARQDILVERQERAYIAWLNHVLGTTPVMGSSSRLSNFGSFVSRYSTPSPPTRTSNSNSAYSGSKLIDEVYWDEDCLTSSPCDKKYLGRSPRKPLVPLNGVGNQGFESPAVAKRTLKDVFSTSDRKAYPGQSPATPHLSSKRLKMIMEHGFSYPRDAHLQDICRLSELARRLKLHFNRTEREDILLVINQLAKHIDEGRLRMKKGCAILADVALRKKALHVLLNYNAYWMRIGLYIVLGHTALLRERLIEENSKQTGDKGVQDAEFAVLEAFLERHFLAHPGLAKKFATNRTIEGLYREGYSEALGRVILKRFFLLVLVLDKAKCKATLNITDGIDGVDGGSPPLFRSDARVKSSLQTLQDFLSDVMHGEGDVVGNLSALGYHVHHYQAPLADYNFTVVDLIEDLQDGVRLCRLVQLLAANDTFFLEHLQMPSSGRKRRLHNCQISLGSLAQAGVPLEDENGCSINAEDIVGGNRDKVFSLLWNIMVHLQIPLLVSRPRLSQEIAKLQGTEGEVSLGLDIGTVELLLKWTQVTCMISGNLHVGDFKTSFADGQALCLIVGLYLPLLLPQNAILRPASFEEHSGAAQIVNTPDVEVSLTLSYKKVVAHNFGLVQDAARKLGNIPEVVQLVDLLGDPGMSERNIIIFVAFLCSRLLKDKPLDLEMIYRGRISQDADANHQLDELLRHSSQCNLESESPSGFNRSYSVPWPQHEALCGTLQPQVPGLAQMNEAATRIPSADTANKIYKIQAWWRAVLIRRKRAQKIQMEWCRFSIHLLRRHDSALTIQAHWQGYVVRRMLKDWTVAATVIQFRYRSHVQRMQTREQAAHVLQYYFRAWAQKRRYRATVTNMCKIQACWWAHEARGNFLRERNAVRKIETEWLHYVVRKKFHFAQAQWQKSQSAQIILAHWRGYSTRQTLKKTKSEQRMQVPSWIQNGSIQLTSTHITRIEPYWGIHVARQQFEAEKQAAKRIQTAWRYYTARKKKQLSRLAVQARGSTRIQACWRGHIVRKEYDVLKQAAKKIQWGWRQFIARRRSQLFVTALQARQSIRIQACWRGHVARTEYDLLKQAAKKIQWGWRQFIALRKSQLLVTAVQARQSIRIQACWRGHMALQHFGRQKQAARKIQREWRHLTAHRRNRHASAITIQARWKCHLARGMYSNLKTRVLTIQRSFRRYLQLKSYQRLKGAVIVIQARYRAHLQERMYQAACRIQSQWRAHSCRTRFLHQKISAKKIQHQWRNFSFRKYTSSAIKIQAKWRGYQARKALSERTAAACVIQCYYRGRLRRTSFLSFRKAAVVIQAHYRAFIQRSVFKITKLSICKIQAGWRGCQARKVLSERAAAACVIQCYYRGRLRRTSFISLRKAAVVIQAHYRAFIQRSVFKITQLSICRIQAGWRGCQARKVLSERAAAACVIQCYYRGRLRRTSFLSLRKAAVVIQAHYRAFIQRSVFKITQLSICRIQARWRGCQARKVLSERTAAACVIQCYYRGRLRRTSFLSLRKAAVVIQAHYRAIIQRSVFKITKLSICRIQARWRGCQARKVLSKRTAAACVIQCYYRGRLHRTSFISLRKAAVVIQAHYRAFIQRSLFKVTQLSVCRIQAAGQFGEQREGGQKIQSVWRHHRTCRKHESAITPLRAAAWLRYSSKRVHWRWKAAAILLQNCYNKGHIQRRLYASYKDAAACIVQAQVKGWIQRRSFRATLGKICKLQLAWRAHSVRQQYKRTRMAVEKSQRACREFLARRRSRLNAAAAHIQSVWRGYSVKTLILRWTAAAILIQKRYRRYICRRDCRRSDSAVGRCQALWRGNVYTEGAATRIQAAVRGMLQRRRFDEQRKAARRIQSAFRTWHANRVFLCLRSATVIRTRNKHLELKAEALTGEAALKIQALWKTQRQRRQYKALLLCKAFEADASAEVHCASGDENLVGSYACLESEERAGDGEILTDLDTVRLADAFGAPYQGATTSTRSISRKTSAAVIIQKHARRRRLRAKKLLWQLAQEEHTMAASGPAISQASHAEICDHSSIRSSSHTQLLAARLIQCRWRGHRAKQNIGLEKENVELISVDNFTQFQYVDNSVDQSTLACQHLGPQELKAGHVILNGLRTFMQRTNHLRLRRCAVVIQRHVRGWIQRSRFALMKHSAIVVQARWRGYTVRRRQSHAEEASRELRLRMQMTAATVQDSERLCNRLTEALSLLLCQKTVSGILTTCRTIDVATQLSFNCCERLADAGAITKILLLIQTINRSAPLEQVLKHALSILNNLSHYLPLATRIAQAPSAISIVSEKLHTFRNNEEIFAQALSVLQIVCKTSAGIEVLQRERPVFRRLQLIAQSLERKVLVEKRNLEKLPWATVASVQRKSAQKKMSEANCQFLSTMALMKDINRLSHYQTTTSATPMRVKTR